MVFKPGNKANPKGRPKGTKGVGWVTIEDLKTHARTFTDEATTTIVEIMRSKSAPPATRLKAAEIILDRGWGRTAPDVTVNVLNMTERMGIDDLRDAITAQYEEIAALEERLGDASPLSAPLIEGVVRDEAD